MKSFPEISFNSSRIIGREFSRCRKFRVKELGLVQAWPPRDWLCTKNLTRISRTWRDWKKRSELWGWRKWSEKKSTLGSFFFFGSESESFYNRIFGKFRKCSGLNRLFQMRFVIERGLRGIENCKLKLRRPIIQFRVPSVLQLHSYMQLERNRSEGNRRRNLCIEKFGLALY